MLRLFFQLLLLYLLYRVVKWALGLNRPSVSGKRKEGPEIREEDIEDAKFREIKD